MVMTAHPTLGTRLNLNPVIVWLQKVVARPASPDISGEELVLRVPLRALPLFVCCVVLLSACGGGDAGSVGGSPSGKLQVIAAENFWGSIASQLGGNKVAVQSIIVNPSTDPHSYEPKA